MLLASCLLVCLVLAACSPSDSVKAPTMSAAEKAAADSAKQAHQAKMLADSLRMEALVATAQYPLLKGSKWSGVIPVDNPTEIPDPNKEYKLLFELTAKNPDSTAKEINESLDEVTRILNLHYASGIPAKNIIPVVVIHGPGLVALKTNEAYKKRFKIDNPNLTLISDMEKIGAKFIACGQAMAFFDIKKDELLPEVKITLSAQTVLSNYQSQGYTLYKITVDK
jgi:intracellular sulfur oxidation DsrE/DsrF family protein